MNVKVTSPAVGTVESLDPLWTRLRNEAEAVVASEPALAGFVYTYILNHARLEDAVAHRIADRLDSPAFDGDLINRAFAEMLEREHTYPVALRADLVAVYDRDPACTRFIEPVLYFKGFHAIQTHRLAHWLHRQRPARLRLLSAEPGFGGVPGRHQSARADGARHLHRPRRPASSSAQTAVIEDDVSILQNVTLGGTGKETGDRHPKIRRGVLIGAGAKILGNIEVGRCSRVAAGSVVLKPVPPNATVAGVPARVVGQAGCAEPARSMDQVLRDSDTDVGFGI